MQDAFTYWADDLGRAACFTAGCRLDRCVGLNDDGTAVYAFVPYWDDVLSSGEDYEILIEWRGDQDAFALAFDNIYRQNYLLGR